MTRTSSWVRLDMNLWITEWNNKTIWTGKKITLLSRMRLFPPSDSHHSYPFLLSSLNLPDLYHKIIEITELRILDVFYPPGTMLNTFSYKLILISHPEVATGKIRVLHIINRDTGTYFAWGSQARNWWIYSPPTFSHGSIYLGFPLSSSF